MSLLVVTCQKTLLITCLQDGEAYASNKPATRSKIEVLIRYLQRPRGVTLAAMCKATDWQSHSVRAALSRMPARGHTVIRIQEKNRLTRYRIT